MMTKTKLTKELRHAITVMKKSDGCYEIPLEGNLSVFVGWLDGYDPDDTTCVHDKKHPTYCLNAGIKVNTSDDMKTDYEYLNAPYYDSGDVWCADVSISPKEDYKATAEYLLAEFSAMQECDIEDDGRIANFRCPEDQCSGLCDF